MTRPVQHALRATTEPRRATLTITLPVALYADAAAAAARCNLTVGQWVSQAVEVVLVEQRHARHGPRLD